MTIHNGPINLRELFFDNAQESFAIFDKDLNFIDVNEVLLHSLRLKREQIVGKNISEISPGIKETERYKLYQEVMQTGKPLIIDEVRMHPSLGNFVSRISIFKVGEELGLAALNISDISEAIDELETFIYKSSHDMRGPIVSILGLISLAEADIKDLETAKDYLNSIKLLAERLDSILKQLVETTKIRQGDKTIRLIKFHQLVDDVVKSLSYMKGFNEVRIEQNISAEQKFYSDKSPIISVLQNLVDNAIKYRKENLNGTFIKITVSDEEDGVKITVADNGIGIKDDLQKDVFNMFFRATNQASGSGLGLYTVKHCIKKLDGQIMLDSKENIGTTFTIYLANVKIDKQKK